MNDWYYFGNLEGNGAGIEGINTPVGNL